MDWNAAIERNREALKRVLAMLVAMARIDAEPHPGVPAEGAPRRTLPRYLYRAVLALLRPAEAAARRLIIIMARDVPAPPLAGRRETAPPQARMGKPGLRLRPRIANPALPQPGKTRNPPALPLFDSLPRWRGRRRPRAIGVPRISLPGFGEPFPIAPRRPPRQDDPIDATRLASRLSALGRALDDLPRQATRFARWRASRDARRERGGSGASRRSGRVWPLRPGRPPGSPPARRKARAHEVHDVLDDVHGLALWALEPADTS